MGLVTHAYLYCDGESDDCYCRWCNLDGHIEHSEAHGGDSGHETKGAYKREAIKEGWLFRPHNKAYCPACRKTLKESPQ